MSALRQRTARPLTVPAMVALISEISAGCGSNASSETGTGRNKKATDRDKAVKSAECLLETGVSDFPDPNAQGEFVYGVSASPRCSRGPSTRASMGGARLERATSCL
jgi:hypothetical protein